MRFLTAALALSAAALFCGSPGLAGDGEGDGAKPPKEEPKKEEPKEEGADTEKEEPKEDVLAKVRTFGKRFRFKFRATHTVVVRTDKGDEKSVSEDEREWWPGAWFDRKEDLKWEGASFTASWDGGTDAWREVAKVEGRMSADGTAVESLKVEYKKDWKETKGVIKVAIELKGVKLRFAGEESVRYLAEGEDAKKALVKYEEFEDYGTAGAEDFRARTWESADWKKDASLELLFADEPW